MKSFAVAAVVTMLTGVGAAAQQAQIYKAGDKGVTSPQIVTELKPSYTPEAMRAKISGSVEMTTVIGTDGKPSDIKVVRSLDAGLDKKAIEALSEWRFKPAMKDGQAVPMLVTVEMSFTLRDRQVYDKTFTGVTAPVVVKELKPSYTADAMRRKVSGSVEVEGIVGVDGKFTEVRVTKALDADLDARAVAAAGQWLFRPATLNGHPVPYRVTLELRFTLR